MDVGAAKMLSLPIELTDEVLILVHSHRDLLSLALTCSALRDIIIPKYLHWRYISAAESHTSLWAHLVARPDLARNVRQLTLYNRTEALHASLRGRYNIHLPPSFQTIDGLSALFAMRGTDVWNCAGAREFGRTMFARALSSMTRLKTIVIRAGGTVTLEETDAGRDLLSLVSRAVPTVEQLRVIWCRANYVSHLFSLPSYQASSSHPLFSMYDLRTLEFPGMRIETDLWPSFCEMLSSSPQLQSLSLPVFVSTADPEGTTTALTTEMPFLACLRRLTVPSAGGMGIWAIHNVIPILAMLLREPPITELRWGNTTALPDLDQPFPKLPALRKLQDTATSFIIRFLHKRPAGSVKLRVLDSVAFYFEPLLLIDALRALDSQTLRELHISSLDSVQTLCTVAHMFPMLEQLLLPSYCGCTRPGLATRTARTMWRAISLATLRDVPRRMDWRRMPIHKTLALFPKLSTINSVDTGDKELNRIVPRGRRRHPEEPPVASAKTVLKLRKQYPRLLSINGWTLDSKPTTSPSNTLDRLD